MKYFGWGILILIALAFTSILFKACSTSTAYVNNGINTAYNEYKPEALLKKYEWFKDAASGCDQKLATLQTYESRFNNLKQSYGADSLRRKSWERSDLEQWNVWQSEYLGVKASYNDLASQYNSAMVKFNYRFCNVGQLPQGTDTPLPREFKPYITN